MLLIGVKESNGWLSSRWNLTYRVSWKALCKAVYASFDFYNGAEVLVDGNKMTVANKEAILQLEEGRELIIRGYSKIINVPLMITFYNQLQAVDVSVPLGTDEFSSADYQKFNLSLGQYMDSLELSMYR